MGERLVKYYQLIQNELGLSGRTRLAIETKIPSTKAALEPDTEANVAAFQAAYKRLTGKSAPPSG